MFWFVLYLVIGWIYATLAYVFAPSKVTEDEEVSIVLIAFLLMWFFWPVVLSITIKHNVKGK